jgi:hypothetical protein
LSAHRILTPVFSRAFQPVFSKCIRRFTALTVLLIASTTLAGPHKLRVDDPAMADSLLAQGARLIGDYGSFQIIETGDAPAVKSGDDHAQFVDRLNFIQLSAKPLNTRAPEVQSIRKTVGSFIGRRLHLVHFVGPVKPEWRKALEQSGGQIVSYLPQNAYLIYSDAAALSRMQTWAGAESSVQWEGPYLPDYKIHPGARSVDEKGNRRSIGTDTFAIQLVADDEANAATLGRIDQWKLGPVRNEFRVLSYHNIIVSLPPERLKDIAAQPDVISIQPHFEPTKKDERQDQILAGNLAGTVPGGPGYLAWLAARGFTQAQFDASGFAVDVSDSGIDNGTLKPGHFGLYPSGNTLRHSRVAYSRLVGKANPGSSLKGCDGHGTLNTHIIAGYDDLDGFPHTDSAGFSYGLGVCPFVRVGASVVFDPDLFTSPNFRTLQTLAYNSGARISNNSWGSTNGGAYDMQAQFFDALVRDVGASAQKRQMVIVFVAGNEGPDPQTINSPGTAKNVLTVGAGENVRSLSPANGGTDPSGNDGCGTPDSSANSANDVTDFSSRGPCADGRMKPDLIAPGSHITGGVPQGGTATTNGTGAALSCFLANASSVCGIPGTDTADFFFPLGQQFYTVSTGTSHAAPAVSGACALLRQYFINNTLAPPSPAMSKAFLMNSARYTTGAYANDTLWSPSQGMGELDLGTAFDAAPRILRDQMDKFTATGQTRTFTGLITDPTKPFRVTLAWTDAPGDLAAANALVNDLDLTVTVGGNSYKGNVFSGPYSITGGSPDSRNNVESVFLPAGISGNFTVTVTAADITADGLVPGGSIPEQDFALVIYSGTPTALPFVPSAAFYSGLFYQSNGVRFLASGAVAVTTTARGAYTGTLRMGASRFSFSGLFDTSGMATKTIRRIGTNALTLTLQVDAADNNRITGTVGDGTWLADLHADITPFGKSNHTPLAGKFTLLISGPGDGSAATPQGDGYGSLIVNPLGGVLLSGVLADGTRLTQTANLVGRGQWPLYVSLYGGKGQILGWLIFTNTQDLGGAISWIKQPIPKTTFYPAGFDVETESTGSSYQPPLTSATPILDFSSGRVVLTDGNLAGGITNAVTIGLNNRVVDNTISNKLTLALIPSSGLFRGTAVNPVTRKLIAFNGALLQKQNLGSGNFLGTNQCGKVFFGP